MTGTKYWSSKLHERKEHEAQDRSSAHYKAWNCPLREQSRIGEHFKLDDAIMWMRLMFWAVREEGMDVEPFYSWYVKFISHFIRIYERTAPPYAIDAANWSLDEENIK